MAEKIVIELDIDAGSVNTSFQKVEQKAAKTAKNVGSGFAGALNKNISLPLKSLGAQFIALGSAAAAAFGTKAIIEAASVQQDAVNQLNTSLRLAGSFSEEASKSFQNLAASLEANGTIGDEVILQQAALARNFTKTNEEAEKLTRAAVELSAATGKSLESSVTNLGKTFAGLAGELGESVPALRELTAEQLKSGAALDFVLKRFGGASAAQLNTFSGAVENAKNSFGTLLENLGRLITESPVVIALIKNTGAAFNSIAAQVGQIDISNVTEGLFSFAEGVASFVVAPAELAINIFNVLASAAKAGVAESVANLGLLGTAVAKLIEKFSPDSELAQGLRTFGETSREVAVGAKVDFENSIDNILNFEQSQALIDRIGAFKEDVKAITQAPVAENGEDPTAQAASGVDILKEKFSGLGQAFKETGKQFTVTSKQIAGSVINGIGNAAGSAFASFGAALVKGENALAAFGKAFAASIGQAAVQLGTRFILEGVAISFNPLLGGPAVGGPLIAAGGALATFGGALGAAVGGGGAAATAPGGTGVGFQGGQQQVADVAATDPTEAQPTVVQNISFDGLIDTDDGARRIADILNNGVDNQGVILKRSFA